MQKKDNIPCIFIFTITLLVLLVSVVSNIGQSFLDGLKAIGLCLGAAVVLLALFVIISLLSSRLVRKGRNYSLRCYPAELQSPSTYPLPPNLPEAPGQESIRSLYLLGSLTNYGLRLAPHPLRPGWKWFPADNATRFNQLSDTHPGRLVIPTYSLNLYYRLITRQGNLEFATGPSDAPGFSGDLPAPLDGQSLEIIIIYTSTCDPRKLNMYIPRAQPLKLTLVVLDKYGQEDPAATCEFYNELWKTQKPSDVSNDDDDSWMYRSRPTMPW